MIIGIEHGKDGSGKSGKEFTAGLPGRGLGVTLIVNSVGIGSLLCAVGFVVSLFACCVSIGIGLLLSSESIICGLLFGNDLNGGSPEDNVIVIGRRDDITVDIDIDIGSG